MRVSCILCISGDIPPCLRIMQHPVNPCHFKLSQGTHTNTQADVQIKHGHVRQRTHTNAQDFRTSWQSWGPKTQSYQWRKHRRQGNEMLKQEENFMLTTTCNNMSEMHTHTHTHIQKHASRHTLPTGLDWKFCSNTFRLHPTDINRICLPTTPTHTHIQSICISLTLAVFQ